MTEKAQCRPWELGPCTRALMGISTVLERPSHRLNPARFEPPPPPPRGSNPSTTTPGLAATVPHFLNKSVAVYPGGCLHLRTYAFQGIDTEQFWDDLADLMVKTLLSVAPQLEHVYNASVPHKNNGNSCFEILGFDVMVDSKYRHGLWRSDERAEGGSKGSAAADNASGCSGKGLAEGGWLSWQRQRKS